MNASDDKEAVRNVVIWGIMIFGRPAYSSTASMQEKSTRWQPGDSGVPRPGQRWQRHRGDRWVQTPHDSRWSVFVFVFFVGSVFVFVSDVVFALAFVFKSSLFYLLIINPQATCSQRRRWWCWSTPPTRTATEVSTFKSSWKSWCDTWSGQKVKIRSDQSWTKQLPKNHNERTLHKMFHGNNWSSNSQKVIKMKNWWAFSVISTFGAVDEAEGWSFWQGPFNPRSLKDPSIQS